MIDIRKIQPGESAAINTTVDIAMPKEYDMADTAVNLAGRLKNACGERFVLEAQAHCRLMAACSRCLTPVEHPLSFHINENFVEEEAATDEDIGFSDYSIDILPAIQRNLFLNIPMKLLCAEDCAGLCKQCGKNLNEGNCGCEGEIVNEEFRQLLQYFSD